MGIINTLEVCQRCNTATTHEFQQKSVMSGSLLVLLGESVCTMCGNTRAWSIKGSAGLYIPRSRREQEAS